VTKKVASKPAPPTAKRCAIYTRKSHEKGLEQEFNSLDAQRETCLRYIQNQPGWSALPESYDDGGFTGKNTDRPAFQRLLRDVQDGKVDVIVVYKLDRFSRSLLDFLKIQECLDKLGCAFVSVTQHFDTSTAMGRLILNVLMSFSQFEREMTSERIRDKLAASRRKGKWTGGHAPFGYVSRDKRLVANPAEAATVRDALDLFLKHERLTRVAELLNDRAAPCPTRRGEAIGWTKVAVLRLLKNPVYAGLVSYRGELHPGEHQALVERDVFERVQAVLQRRRHDRSNHGVNPEYVLRGLLRCGTCGSAMVPASTRKAGREYRYYRCSERNKNGSGKCQAVSVPAPAIEAHVVSLIADVAANKTFVAELSAALGLKMAQRRQALEAERAELPSRIAAVSGKLTRLVDEVTALDGRGREVAQQHLEREGAHLGVLERRLQDVERELLLLKDSEVDIAWIARTLKDFSRIWDKLTHENRARLLSALVDEVMVNEQANQVEVRLADVSGSIDGAPEAA
jgi:site-specific DNA recombinase